MTCIQSSNSLRLSALRDCRYALVVYISTSLLQFGEVEGEAQSKTQAGQGSYTALAGPRSAEKTSARAQWLYLQNYVMRWRVMANAPKTHQNQRSRLFSNK